MTTEEITIRVDSDAARAYRATPEQERRKLDLLLSLRLHDVLDANGSLEAVMRDISHKAQERGLAPETLESILHADETGWLDTNGKHSREIWDERVERVLTKAVDVLGSSENAISWLEGQNRALGGAVPFNLLDTEEGADEVLAVLGRIEHGVYS